MSVDSIHRPPPTPWITILLISLCVVVFAIQVYARDRLGVQLDERYGFIPAAITGNLPSATDGGYGAVLLTIFTSAFLHAGVVHLIGNMYFFWMFGRQVEESLGRPLYFAFVVTVTLVSALSFTASHPHSQTPCIGASGFISGIMGAYLLLFPTAKMHYVQYGVAREYPAWVFLGFWILQQLFFASLNGRYGNENIAFWSHVGGFAAGVLLSWILWKAGLAATDDATS